MQWQKSSHHKCRLQVQGKAIQITNVYLCVGWLRGTRSSLRANGLNVIWTETEKYGLTVLSLISFWLCFGFKHEYWYWVTRALLSPSTFSRQPTLPYQYIKTKIIDFRIKHLSLSHHVYIIYIIFIYIVILSILIYELLSCLFSLQNLCSRLIKRVLANLISIS